MFSGLTSQVSSWMGTVKGDQEEEVPTPTEDNNALVSPDKKIESPTKQTAGSKIEMFTNVKNQFDNIGGWLGSSIPKLRKGEGEGFSESQEPIAAEAVGPSTTETAPAKDDDDRSSATGGADSGPQSATDSPTEEHDGQFGNVQSKALAGAKSFGSFLYSAVNKAGKTVSEAGAKIKESVEKNSILGEFNKEQDAFVKGQNNTTATALPPWVGCANEAAIKEECLGLSTDRRNFVRNPPSGVNFPFNYNATFGIAMAIMEQDPNLEKMRYDLVPKVVTEDIFWRNYFYRVSLICEANELKYMSRRGLSEEPATETYTSDQLMDSTTKDVHEFVSDMLQASSEDLVEVQEGMKKLVVGPKNKEEEWERELVVELQDYELISDEVTNSKIDSWDQDIEEMLLQEETDLK